MKKLVLTGAAGRLGSYLREPLSKLTDQLVRAIDTPTTGFSVVYGVPNNDRAPVDNSAVSYLGYKPKDNAEQFADKILKDAPVADTNDVAQMCHGGPFASIELGNSGLATMNIVDDKKQT